MLCADAYQFSGLFLVKSKETCVIVMLYVFVYVIHWIVDMINEGITLCMNFKCTLDVLSRDPLVFYGDLRPAEV